MNCRICGNPLREGARFCASCGSKVEPATSAKEVFLENLDLWKECKNNSDLQVYPDISGTIFRPARETFQIVSEEESLLVVRDTSPYNSMSKGYVITDKALYYKEEENSTIEKLYWEAIYSVEFKENSFIFFCHSGKKLVIPINIFLKSNIANAIGSALFGSILAKPVNKYELLEGSALSISVTLNQMAMIESGKEEDRLNNLILGGNYGKAISILEEKISINSSDKKSLRHLQIRLADLYCRIGNYNKVENICKEIIRETEENSPESIKAKYYNAISAEKLGNFHVARMNSFDVKRHGGIVLSNDPSMSMDEMTNVYTCSNHQFQKDFFSIPYLERKVILPLKHIERMSLDHVCVVDMNQMPQIDFPIGHPIENHLYVGHPFLPHKYIPIEEYQLDFVKDKIDEFCVLAQGLGATEISTEIINNNTTGQYQEAFSSNTIEAENDLGLLPVGASQESLRGASSTMLNELKQHISRHQTFEPKSAPFVPEGLVWLSQEPSWQRLVKQRLSGGSLMSHEERIKTHSCQMINAEELESVKFEAGICLVASYGQTANKQRYEEIREQKDAILSIKVKFADIAKLNHSGIEVTLSGAEDSAKEISASELEYLEELKECLADGEIGPRERRLLDKIRLKLDITEERAQELEASLANPVLTEEEKEYLNEFRECSTDGTVSDKERRLLEKVRKMLGISEERAKEIEQIK